MKRIKKYDQFVNESSEKELLNKHGIKFLDGLTFEELEEQFPWILEAKIQDAELEYIDEDLIRWYDGTWIDGTWEYGLWENGTWKKGTWEDGEWHGGTWENGTWEGGTWENGTWLGGTWKKGTWEYGIWKGGTWKGGTWEDGIRDGEKISNRNIPEKIKMDDIFKYFNADEQEFESWRDMVTQDVESDIKYGDLSYQFGTHISKNKDTRPITDNQTLLNNLLDDIPDFDSKTFTIFEIEDRVSLLITYKKNCCLVVPTTLSKKNAYKFIIPANEKAINAMKKAAPKKKQR
jgi:hypothetical protein